MHLKSLIYSLFMLLLLPAAASAQRGGNAEWELLGEQQVGFGVDSDSIRINQNEEWFRNRAYKALRFGAEGNGVHLISLRIHYINGHVEDLPVDKRISRGSQLMVDLRGERSFLKQIDMRYRAANLGLSIGQGGIKLQQAVVKVYGERVSRRPDRPEPPMAGRGWEEIDTVAVRRRDEQVTLRTDRGDGRLGQIKLKALGEPVRIGNVSVRFRNGETQTIAINRRLDRGEETPALDLEGRQRVVETVSVDIVRRSFRGGEGQLQLIGTRRPSDNADAPASDPYLARGWQLLGTQSVGPRVDRDVIEIGQTEEWYRNRAFRMLHFVAERGDVFVRSLRITYLNGFAEEFAVDREFRAGTDVAVDLRGDRSYLRSVELVYRSTSGRRREAVVKVYGEPAGRR